MESSNKQISPQTRQKKQQENKKQKNKRIQLNSDLYISLKKFASNPEQNELENENDIKKLEKYSNSKKLIFLDDIYEKQKTIQPSIFRRNNFQINKSNKNLTPNQIAFEKYLNLITQLYYNKSTTEIKNETFESKIKSTRGRKAKNQTQEVEEKQDCSQESEEDYIMTNLQDTLISPLRKKQIFELWSPLEIAIFETCICRYGKQFSLFQYMIKTKNHKEIVDFYRNWKITSHYKAWKYYKNLYNNKFQSWV